MLVRNVAGGGEPMGANLRLAVLCQNTWGNLVDLGNQLEHWVIWKVLESELALRDVTWVSLAEDGVAVTWNNLASVEGGPEVVSDGLVAEIVTNGSLHLLEPVEDLLVGKTVERTSQTVETSGEGQHWGAESGADQVGGVGTDVSTLVVSVDGEVESHQLNKVLVVTETELVGEVVGEILVLLDRGHLSALEDVLVDASGDGWELGNKVHRVLECVAPVLLLVHALGICLCECGLVLKSSHCDRELCHWVEVAWATVDELLDELWDVGSSGPFGRKITNLLLTWDLAGKEKPEETYG